MLPSSVWDFVKSECLRCVTSSRRILSPDDVFSHLSIFNPPPPIPAPQRCIGDRSARVRSTIGNIITTVASHGGLAAWADLIPNLLHLASLEDANICEVGRQ